MQLARRILPALALAALLAPLAGQYRARAAESDAPARSWQGPATAAAEAAANQAAKDAVVPPQHESRHRPIHRAREDRPGDQDDDRNAGPQREQTQPRRGRCPQRASPLGQADPWITFPHRRIDIAVVLVVNSAVCR